MSEMTFKILFEAGEGDGYWTIEESADGLLALSSNAETRRILDTDRHLGWDVPAFQADLESEGVPDDLIRRYFEQAGLDYEDRD